MIRNNNLTLIVSAAAMLAIAATLFIFSGCSTTKAIEKQQRKILASYRSHVLATIPEQERADRLIELGEGLHKQILADTETLRGLADELGRLNARYDTTRSEMEDNLEAINAHRVRMRERILEVRAEAVSLTTPAEWDSLINRGKTLMSLIKENPGVL